MNPTTQAANKPQSSQHHVLVCHMRVFDYLVGGGGFQFLCDEGGTVSEKDLTPAAAENLQKCIAHEFNVVDRGVVRFETVALLRPGGRL